jgi:hypothetical protein
MGATMEVEWIPKLYLVSRGDLPVGVQACQAIHAMREFVADHPEEESKWYRESNHIAFLEAPDKDMLEFLINEANENGILYSAFYEPDIENELTAVAFSPTMDSRELLSQLPTALKTKKRDWF